MGGYFNIFILKQAVAVVICNLLSLCLASAWVPTWPSWSHFGSFGPYKAPEFLIHLRAGAAGPAHLPQAQSYSLLCHSGRGVVCRLSTPAAFQGLLGLHGDLPIKVKAFLYHQVAKTGLPLPRVLTKKEGRNLSSYGLSSPGFRFYLAERKAGHMESSSSPLYSPSHYGAFSDKRRAFALFP